MPKEKSDLEELVTKFMKAIEDYGLQKASVQEYRTSCNSLLKFAKEQGYTQYSPELWQLYSEELDHRVVAGENCKEYRRFKGRVLRMLASLAETGSVDFSSALTRPRKYKLTDIDWSNHSISLIQSKTHSAITVELNGTTLNALADYILDARPECSVPQVFITTKAPYRALSGSFASMIDKYCMTAGVKKVPFRAFHSLRRSFETVLAANGVPIETVSQMVGHKSISEDKPYITHDKEKAAFVALDFSDVPIRHGIYARVLSEGNGGAI